MEAIVFSDLFERNSEKILLLHAKPLWIQSEYSSTLICLQFKFEYNSIPIQIVLDLVSSCIRIIRFYSNCIWTGIELYSKANPGELHSIQSYCVIQMMVKPKYPVILFNPSFLFPRVANSHRLTSLFSFALLLSFHRKN